MALSMTFFKRRELLIVEAPPPDINLPPEIISMKAMSGGWRYAGTHITAQGLPAGKWLITDDPHFSRRWNYFGLFRRDGNVNDQFLHRGVWRNGIRFGHHHEEGSHGCIMTMPDEEADDAALTKWHRIQELVRAAPTRLIHYQNNEDPLRSDPNTYTLRAYFDLVVKEF